MTEFLFYNKYEPKQKERCFYCGKTPEFINCHPEFHTGRIACVACVTDGNLTPHFRSYEDIELGSYVYHVRRPKNHKRSRDDDYKPTRKFKKQRLEHESVVQSKPFLYCEDGAVKIIFKSPLSVAQTIENDALELDDWFTDV
jgi:hypothetical protein